jgi:hypothetical protein
MRCGIVDTRLFLCAFQGTVMMQLILGLDSLISLFLCFWHGHIPILAYLDDT